MLEPTLFSVINLALDLVLMVLLSNYLPRHVPRLFVLLIICNLGQHFISVPIDQIPGLKKDGYKTPPLGEILQSLRNVDLKSGRIVLPPPQIILPAILQHFTSSDGRTADLKLFESEKKKDVAPDSFRIKWMRAMKDDPYAIWLFVRIFWFAGTLFLFLQRSTLGAEVVAFQLLPIPFLSLAVPYAYYWISSQPFVIEIESIVRQPDRIWNYATPGNLVIIAIVVMGMVAMAAMMILYYSARRISPKHRLLDQFLDPEIYLVRLNGDLLPFSVEGSKIIISGMAFDCRNISVNPDTPHVWKLSSNTLLQFEKK